MLRSIWDIEDSYYHIFNRGVNKQQLFYDDQDRWYFIKVLKGAITKYGIKIHAMHFMNNHFHLIIHTDKANLSRAMQTIGRSYAQYFIGKYKDLKKDGHAFRGRFGRKIIDTDNYANILLDYIHLNAVKDRISRHPDDDRWSSYDFYKTGNNSFGILTKGIFENKFRVFENGPNKQITIDQATWDWNPDDHTIGGVILGTHAFAKKIYETKVKAKTPETLQPRVEKALGLNHCIKSNLIKEYITSLNLDEKLHSNVLIYSLMQWSELNSFDIEYIVNKSPSAIRNTKYRVNRQLEKKKKPLIGVVEKVEEFVISKTNTGSLKREC